MSRRRIAPFVLAIMLCLAGVLPASAASPSTTTLTTRPAPTVAPARDLHAEARYRTILFAAAVHQAHLRDFYAAVWYQRILAFAAAVEASKRPAVPAVTNSVWDRLAHCESTGNWHINTGSFDGGLQFLPSTWTANGGGRYAPYAWQATREQQIAVAEHLLAATDGSYRASWPACSRRLGLP